MIGTTDTYQKSLAKLLKDLQATDSKKP